MRMQISIDPAQRAHIRRRADEAGISIAEYVRRLIAADLGERQVPRADVTELFGLGSSGGSDVARHKDAYLGEAADRAAHG